VAEAPIKATLLYSNIGQTNDLKATVRHQPLARTSSQPVNHTAPCEFTVKINPQNPPLLQWTETPQTEVGAY